MREQGARLPDHRPRLSGPLLLPRHRHARSRRRELLQLLDAIRTVTKANIVAADLNELAPTLDTTGVSTATACKVLRETLIALDKGWPGFQV